MLQVKKTTYKVDGYKEPCFEVSNGFAMVRLAKCYHLIGGDTLLMTEYLDGNWNAQEEWMVDFDALTKADARELAKRFSVYLTPIP